MARYLYVGTATKPEEGPQGAGIRVYRMDSENGTLQKAHTITSGPNPSFLALDPQKQFLFSVNETDEGAVSSFRVNRSDGSLELINRVAVDGVWPCYVTLSPDRRRLLTANYGTGSVTVVPVAEDGRLGERVQQVRHEGAATDPRRRMVAYFGRGPVAVVTLPGAEKVPDGVVPDRQERTHTHSVIYDPSGRFVLAADLGMDRVWVYRYQDGMLAVQNPGWATGQNEWEERGWMGPSSTAFWQASGGHNLKPGSGPRHLAFHPNGRFLYVSNELSSTVTVFAWNGENGGLKPLQNISTLPAEYNGKNDVAHLAFRADGRVLYVSNRGHNSITAFAVDAESGRLAPVGFYSSEGDWPRNFCLDPDGRFLLAANQRSGNVVVFRIHPETGALEPTGEQVIEPTPFFVMLADL